MEMGRREGMDGNSSQVDGLPAGQYLWQLQRKREGQSLSRLEGRRTSPVGFRKVLHRSSQTD
jgi:hypothetical protein